MSNNLKKRIYLFLDPRQRETIGERIANYFIVFLIIINTLAVILETVPAIYNKNVQIFKIVEVFSVILFTIEYFFRIWTCTLNPKYGHSLTGRLKFIFSFEAIIDLLAIIPFYLPLVFRYDLRFIRILRLIRFTRFLKLARYSKASKVLARVMIEKKEELILAIVITFFLIICASAVMYYAEHAAQPTKFKNIPQTMMWSVATLTTVGSGVYPITTLGKILTAFISMLGIGIFALPAGILASGFSDTIRKEKKPNICPHCGKVI